MSAEQFWTEFRKELVLYINENSYPTVRPPRETLNPEKEGGVATLHFDLVRFYEVWIKIEDWRDLQPVFVDLLREYLESAELDPRKLPSYDAVLKRSGQRIHELAMSGRYPADEVREQWFGGGD